MRLELPAGWTGRLKFGGIRAGVRGELPVLQAGSFSLPLPDDDVGTGAEQTLPTSGIYINVLVYGPPPTAADPTLRTTVPIQVKPSDFRGYEGAIAPNHARIGAVLKSRYFVIDVSLAGSSPPTPEALQQANLVLATFDRTG